MGQSNTAYRVSIEYGHMYDSPNVIEEFFYDNSKAIDKKTKLLNIYNNYLNDPSVKELEERCSTNKYEQDEYNNSRIEELEVIIKSKFSNIEHYDYDYYSVDIDTVTII